MYKLTNKETGKSTNVEERDLAGKFAPPVLARIYDMVDSGLVYEDDNITVEVN